MHALTDDVLAQHGTDRRQTVSAARERRTARALEVQVANAAVREPHLTDEERTPVAESRGVCTELVSGVRLGDRDDPVWQCVADQQTFAVGTPQVRRIEAELSGEWVVKHQQFGGGSGLGLPGDGHFRQLPGKAVSQVESGSWCETHTGQNTGQHG